MNIRTENLGFTYPGKPRPVLKDISLDIDGPGTIGIFGKNGSGKTTLLKLICGLLRPGRGVVRVNGLDPYRHHPTRAGLYFYSDKMEAPGEWTVREFFRRYSALKNPEPLSGHLHRIKDAVERHLPMLAGLLDSRIETLSKGQYNLTLLATVLLADCDIVVLDEPNDGLDLENQKYMLEVIRHLARSKLVLFTSHNPLEILMLSDTLLTIDGDGSSQRHPMRSDAWRVLPVPVTSIIPEDHEKWAVNGKKAALEKVAEICRHGKGGIVLGPQCKR